MISWQRLSSTQTNCPYCQPNCVGLWCLALCTKEALNMFCQDSKSFVAAVNTWSLWNWESHTPSSHKSLFRDRSYTTPLEQLQLEWKVGTSWTNYAVNCFTTSWQLARFQAIFLAIWITCFRTVYFQERFAGSTYATFPAPLHRGQTASLINPAARQPSSKDLSSLAHESVSYCVYFWMCIYLFIYLFIYIYVHPCSMVYIHLCSMACIYLRSWPVCIYVLWHHISIYVLCLCWVDSTGILLQGPAAFPVGDVRWTHLQGHSCSVASRACCSTLKPHWKHLGYTLKTRCNTEEHLSTILNVQLLSHWWECWWMWCLLCW